MILCLLKVFCFGYVFIHQIFSILNRLIGIDCRGLVFVAIISVVLVAVVSVVVVVVVVVVPFKKVEVAKSDDSGIVDVMIIFIYFAVL
jgi:hypothetical protein